MPQPEEWTNPLDLKVGDYVALVDLDYPVPEGVAPWEVEQPTFDGRPLRVVAFSHPFIGVETGEGYPAGIDTRCQKVVKLDRKYAHKMLDVLHGKSRTRRRLRELR